LLDLLGTLEHLYSLSFITQQPLSFPNATQFTQFSAPVSPQSTSSPKLPSASACTSVRSPRIQVPRNPSPVSSQSVPRPSSVPPQPNTTNPAHPSSIPHLPTLYPSFIRFPSRFPSFPIPNDSSATFRLVPFLPRESKSTTHPTHPYHNYYYTPSLRCQSHLLSCLVLTPSQPLPSWEPSWEPTTHSWCLLALQNNDPYDSSSYHYHFHVYVYHIRSTYTSTSTKTLPSSFASTTIDYALRTPHLHRNVRLNFDFTTLLRLRIHPDRSTPIPRPSYSTSVSPRHRNTTATPIIGFAFSNEALPASWIIIA
jgi:hypothetical protein